MSQSHASRLVMGPSSKSQVVLSPSYAYQPIMILSHVSRPLMSPSHAPQPNSIWMMHFGQTVSEPSTLAKQCPNRASQPNNVRVMHLGQPVLELYISANHEPESCILASHELELCVTTNQCASYASYRVSTRVARVMRLDQIKLKLRILIGQKTSSGK